MEVRIIRTSKDVVGCFQILSLNIIPCLKDVFISLFFIFCVVLSKYQRICRSDICWKRDTQT